MSLERDLSHTNYSEALHSRFKQLIGKPRDPREAVTGLLKLGDSQKRALTMALVDGSVQAQTRLRGAENTSQSTER